MTIRTGRPKGLIHRRGAAVSFALAASAVSVVGVSGTSQADTGPGSVTALGAPLAPVVQAVAPVTDPVTQATSATAPVTQTAEPVTQTAEPVTQTVAPVTEPVTTATKPVTQTVATATKSATQAAAAAAKPVIAAVATTTQPVTEARTTATKPVARAAETATAPATQATARVLSPVTTPTKATHASGAAGTARTLRSAASAPARRTTAARPGRHLHVVQAYGASHRRAIGGGRAEIPAAPVRSLPPSLRPVITPAVITFAGRPVAAPMAVAPVTAAPSGGDDSSSTGLGIAALLGAGGAALLRLRQSAAAAGLAEGGTLAALGQSASVFWAGSCYPLGGISASVAPTSSLAATAVRGAGATGGRAQFGVAGVVSNASRADGGRVAPAASSLVRAPGDDRTGLVVLLFAASAAIGAALGALVPGRREIRG